MNNPHHLALLVYHFPPGIIPKAQKHGNAKRDEPFYPSWVSTKELIKSECQASGPKQTVHRVSDQVGGLLSSSYPGQLSRNERQVKHAKSSLKEFNPADELYLVMFQAKQEDISNSFVHDMKVLPEPAVMLSSDYQLNDLVRFGTNSSEHCVFTVV